MDIEKIKESLNSSMKTGDVLFLNEVFKDVPSWDTFIKLIDYIDITPTNNTGIRTEQIAMTESLYVRAADVVDPITKKSAGNTMPELDKVLEFCEEIFEKQSNYGEAYFNFKSNGEHTQPHNDPWTAVGWSCIGEIEWRIYPSYEEDRDESKFVSYMANPGDLMIIPRGTYHKVISLTPRASISLAY